MNVLGKFVACLDIRVFLSYGNPIEKDFGLE